MLCDIHCLLKKVFYSKNVSLFRKREGGREGLSRLTLLKKITKVKKKINMYRILGKVQI